MATRWDREKEKYAFDLNTDPMTWEGSAPSSSFDTDYFNALRGSYDEPTSRRMTEEAKHRATLNAKGKYNYDPNDLSDAGFGRIQEAWSKAYADYEVAAAPSPFGTRSTPTNVHYLTMGAAYNALVRDTVWSDYATATRKYFNAKTAGALADVETGKLKRSQFEQMRKIATEGNEETSEDNRPTGKASVLIGSNIPDRKQKRTSTSRDASTARAKVKVQAKGINI